MANRQCNITLQGLAQLDACGNNLSGVKTMWIVNKDHVKQFNATMAATPTDFDEFVTLDTSTLTNTRAIECYEGKGFAQIFCADDMGELKYSTQGKTTGCKSLKATLDIFHPGFKRTALGALAYFNNQEMVIVVRLNNGELHVLGDEERGAKLSDGMEGTSGKSSEDDNGVNWTFECNVPYPKIFDEDFDPKDETIGLPMITSVSVDDDDTE